MMPMMMMKTMVMMMLMMMMNKMVLTSMYEDVFVNVIFSVMMIGEVGPSRVCLIMHQTMQEARARDFWAPGYTGLH